MKGIGSQKNYHAFNKPVSEERYSEILELIKNDILKDLKLELNKNSWSEEWKKVTQEQWKRISAIPEFDKEVVEGIIGFEINLNEDSVAQEAIKLLEEKGYKIIKT